MPGEEDDASLPVPVRGLVDPEPAGGDDEVGRVVDERAEHRLDLGRVVLPVGVERDDVAGAGADAEVVADPQRDAVAEVDGEDERHRTALDRHPVGGVVPAVDDDDWRHREPARLGRDPFEHVAEVVLLLVGADEGDDRCQREVRVASVEVFSSKVDDEALEGAQAVLLTVGDARHQRLWGWSKTWRTAGSKWASGFVG